MSENPAAPPPPAIHQPDKPTQSHRSQRTSYTMPSLQYPAISYTFGRMDSDWTTHDHTLLIANQDTVSGMTYDQIEQLVTIALPLPRAQFIRMWKTTILKRAQDVYEIEKKQRPPNRLNLHRSLQIPATLSDLLHSIGSFHSNATGIIHDIIPPARPQDDIPEFWELDDDIITLWQRTMGRVDTLYQMKDFPSQGETIDKPLMLTMLHQEDNYSQVKAWTNEPTMNDAYIRMMHDDLFAPHEYITYERCGLTMTQRIHVPTVRGQYVASYKITTNS